MNTKVTDMTLILAVTSMKGTVSEEGTVEEKLLASFRYVRSHLSDLFWMEGNPSEDLQFRTGIGAVLQALPQDSEDRHRLVESIDLLRNITAMMSGVMVDLESLNHRLDTSNPIGLMKLWRETDPAEAS